MPRKGLSFDEAIALFEELPSDDESVVSESENSDNEEYISDICFQLLMYHKFN